MIACRQLSHSASFAALALAGSADPAAASSGQAALSRPALKRAQSLPVRTVAVSDDDRSTVADPEEAPAPELHRGESAGSSTEGSAAGRASVPCTASPAAAGKWARRFAAAEATLSRASTRAEEAGELEVRNTFLQVACSRPALRRAQTQGQVSAEMAQAAHLSACGEEDGLAPPPLCRDASYASTADGLSPALAQRQLAQLHRPQPPVAAWMPTLGSAAWPQQACWPAWTYPASPPMMPALQPPCVPPPVCAGAPAASSRPISAAVSAAPSAAPSPALGPAARETQWAEAGDSDDEALDDMGASPAWQETTQTAMIRGIPAWLERSHLQHLLEMWGWRGTYDLLYVPWDFRMGGNMGYAFINFLRPDFAQRFRALFQGAQLWKHEAEPAAFEIIAAKFQGTATNRDQFRNAPVMSPRLDPRFKPALYDTAGNELPFPAPTRKLKRLKVRRTAMPDPLPRPLFISGTVPSGYYY